MDQSRQTKHPLDGHVELKTIAYLPHIKDLLQDINHHPIEQRPQIFTQDSSFSTACAATPTLQTILPSAYFATTPQHNQQMDIMDTLFPLCHCFSQMGHYTVYCDSH